MLNGRVEPALRMEDPGDIVVSNSGIRIELECLSIMLNGLVVFFLFGEGNTDEDMGLFLRGPEPKRLLIFGDGLIQFTLFIQRVTEEKMCLWKIRRVTQSRLVKLHCFIQFAFPRKQAPQNGN